MNKDYYLCTGHDRAERFSLPSTWTLAYDGTPPGEALYPTVEDMTREAVARPVETPPLGEIVKGAASIAIIIDDCTRPTPVAPMLRVLLPYLAEHGATAEKVAIVVALGTHSPIGAGDLEARVGREVTEAYRIVQHNAWQDDLVPFTLPGDDGRIVRINPAVALADVKIGISSILPHPMAGYGGGPKIIMPGVADFEFVRSHHMIYTIDPRSRAGRTGGNPFHEGCMEVAHRVGLDFSLNCIYSQAGDVVRIIGGSLDGAFAAAVDACVGTLGVRIEEKVDITITSTYPHTHAHQFVKGLSAPDAVTKETGAILLMAPTVTPVPADFLRSFDRVREISHGDSQAFITGAMSKGMPFLPDKPLEFNMAMECAVMRPTIRTILVCPMISESEARTMGFEYAPSVAGGIARLEEAYPHARVAVFPSGGLVVPVAS